MSDAILTVRNLVGGYVQDVDVLHGISLSVEKGDSLGVLGLNGSGKSSFGRALVNQLPYRSGTLFFHGRDISNLSTEELSRKGIRMMFQGGQVFQTLSVWDNLRLVTGDYFYERMELLSPLIPILASPAHWMRKTMADRLSGGQRHQLALAMTLATLPEIVILDEPSAGLSPKSVDTMYNLLREVRERFGFTLVLIEQNIAKAVGFCSSCILIQQGQIKQTFGQDELQKIEDVMFNVEGR